MTKSAKDKYTDPDLRDKIKEEVQAGDKGGEPGQWSARKAQMMAKRYKDEGGGYKGDKDEKAKHLEQWTKEEWQTKDGDANARTDEGTHRYLPKKAWEKLSEGEKEATDEQKLEGSKAGDQYVENTSKAKKARKEVSEELEEEKSANLGSNKTRKTERANEGKKQQTAAQDDKDADEDEEEEEAQMTDEEEQDSEDDLEDDDEEPGVAIDDTQGDAEEKTASLEDEDDDDEFVPDEEK